VNPFRGRINTVERGAEILRERLAGDWFERYLKAK
jgi:hypothetical protein